MGMVSCLKQSAIRKSPLLDGVTYFRAWQRQDVVIFVSDFAQVFWNFAFSAVTSSAP